MKRSFRRITAALLSFLLLICCCIPTGFAAVQMPSGYSEQQVEACIPKAERLLHAVLATNSETADLSATVYKTLFSDGTLNALFSGVYQSFSEYESTFDALGVDISVPAVAAALQDYPGVYAVLYGKTAWSQVVPATVNMQWGVANKTQFANALAAMLSPLSPVLYTLLCSGSYKVNAFISLTGADGYKNAVVPLLQRLGCDKIVSQETYTAAATINRAAMVTYLCDMLFSVMDDFLRAPVSAMCTYLPSIADYLNSGGISGTLKSLMEPLQLKISVFSLPGITKLLESTDLFSSSADLTDMLGDLDLSSLMGDSASNLKLANIDLAALAGCGSVQNGAYVANRAQAFVQILTWGIETLKQNRSLLTSAGLDASSAGALLNKDADAMLGMIFKLLTMEGKPVSMNAAFSYPSYTAGTAAFTANLTRENYERVLEQIDPTLNEFLEEFTDLGSLTEVVQKAIYSNKVVAEIMKALYGALDTPETEGISSLLGISVSPAGVASSIHGAFPAAARAIGAAAKWEDLSSDNVRWGFSDGSKDGFTNTLTALLRPFAPYLRFLLAEGSLTLMETVHIGGGNGYETAVLPLLEGLGCDPADMLSYEDYKRGSDTALITGILTPVTSLLDRVCASPVSTVCGLLPNLLYFAQGDLMQQCMTNLLNPVTSLVKDLGMEGMLPEDLTSSMQPDLNVPELMTQLTAGSDLGFTLPEPDLALVQSLGTAVDKTGKRGKSYTYIEADSPLVLVTLLRYILGAVKSSGDPDVLTKLMGDSPMGSTADAADGEGEAGLDMMAMYADKIGAQLADMSVDETIEWLYDLLFAETPKREESTEEEIIPTVIYEKQKDYTTLKRVIIGVLVLALLTGTVIFLAKYDFSAAKEKRQRRKKQKQEMKGRGRTPC